MKKGYYFYSTSDEAFYGVKKKIHDQIKALSVFFDVTEIPVKKEKSNIVKSIFWRVPLGSWGRDYKSAIRIVEIDSGQRGDCFFYIRHQAVDLRYVCFIRKLRSNYRDADIVLEIPTYPYDKELLKNTTMWPWFFKDKFYSRFLKKYVDRIVTYSSDEDIFNIPTIKIINGIDTDRIAPISTDTSDGKVIKIIAVAQFQPSHGYERFINGLKNYYNDGGVREIELHMVGEGSEKAFYEKLVVESNLENRVFFYGIITGDKLDEVYEDKDIGLAGMGLYKRGITKSSALKVREYLAKGLPVVTGVPNDAFSNGGDEFCMEYPNEPGDIDINCMIQWYDALIEEYSDKSQLVRKIRDFAIDAVDIRSTMRPVVSYLENNI